MEKDCTDCIYSEAYPIMYPCWKCERASDGGWYEKDFYKKKKYTNYEKMKTMYKSDMIIFIKEEILGKFTKDNNFGDIYEFLEQEYKDG